VGANKLAIKALHRTAIPRRFIADGQQRQLLKLEKVAMFRFTGDGVSLRSTDSGFRVFPSSDSGATRRD
jgi:hypothetical protein